MNLDDLKEEIIRLGKSPLAEKLYPIPPDLVPLTDVLAILTRFKKDWTEFRRTTHTREAQLISEIFGMPQRVDRGTQHRQNPVLVEGDKPEANAAS